MKKKLLSFVLALCLIIPCAMMFTACKDKEEDPSFNINQNVLTLADEIIDDLTQNIYNNKAVYGTDTPYDIDGIKEKDADFEYYVEVGTVDEIDDVNSITVGDTTFTKDQMFSLSIGNRNQLQAKAFYEEDDKIYVAAPVVVFETVNLSKIKINDVSFDIELEVEATASNFASVSLDTNASSSLELVSGTTNEYNINFNAPDPMYMTYEGANSNDVILTKRTVSGSQLTSANTVNYGLTMLDSGSIMFYPVDSINEATSNKWNGTTMNYEAYVVNGGIYSAVFNFTMGLNG